MGLVCIGLGECGLSWVWSWVGCDIFIFKLTPIQIFQQLNYDPFGYYRPRLVSDSQPNEYLPYKGDYPMNDGHWNLWEIFP